MEFYKTFGWVIIGASSDTDSEFGTVSNLQQWTHGSYA